MFHAEDIYPTTQQERSLDASLRRAAELRRSDLMHQEARNRALREARQWAQNILTDIKEDNIGLARMKCRHLINHLDDEGGTPQMVADHLNMLDDQYPEPPLP